MKKVDLQISMTVYPTIRELDDADAFLLKQAIAAAGNAYAPYSNFLVGAAANLSNGLFLTGSNQENASYPAGLCAERVLLSAAAAQYPGVSISSIAVSAMWNTGPLPRPVAPCGICRQSIMELEHRFNQPVRIIMGGEDGEVFVVESIRHLLPLAFTALDLRGNQP